MKKIFILLLAIMATIFVNAQHQIGIGSTAANEEFLDSKFTNDGGTINVGRITTNNDDDCYIVKLGLNRQIVWQQRLVNTSTNITSGSGNREGFNKVIVCANGDFAVVGSYIINNFIRGIVCRFSSNTGTLLWNSTSTTFSGSNSNIIGQTFSNIIETTNNNLAVVGGNDVTGLNFTTSNLRGNILLLNNNGVQQWMREINTTTNFGLYGIGQMQNGNLIIAGSFNNGGNYRSNIFEISETDATIVSQRDYSITGNIAGVNNNINSIATISLVVLNNVVTINTICFTGLPGTSTYVQGIFTYNQTNRNLVGAFYDNSSLGASTGNFTFYPVGANDFLIAENVNATNGGIQNIITRATNGVITTRFIGVMGNMVGGIGNITSVNGTEFNFVGSTINGADRNGYSLFANMNLTIPRPNICNIQNAINTNINAATPISNASNFALNLINNAMDSNTIITLQITNSIKTDLCGTPPNPTQCPNDTTKVFSKCPNTTIPLNVRTGTTYSWVPSTGLSSTTIQNPTTNVNANTTYVVTITNATTNCTYKDTVKVIVNPLPISNIRDTSLCVGDTIQLNAPTGYTTYSWSPATNINNANIPNPSVWPSATTNYIVTITNSFGCSIKDTVLVTVNNCGCEDSCNWSKTGNTFVKPTNFIGSKNNADFKVRTNNLQRMVVTAAGKIGLNIATPTKTLDVNGEAVVRNLPAANPNDKVVLANATGELKSLAPGAITQYLSGNGTWQTLPTGGGGGTVTAADQGVTLLNNNTVVLGDECGKGGGAFKSNREININNQNLYFNASRAGKIYMGSESAKFEYCKELNTRLEISSAGLEVKNDYATPNPSPSGLRFTNLTAKDDQIENKYGGVLSLDEDGDVIWVKACCNGIQIGKETTSILERLDKLEAELKAIKNENIVLKNKLNQTEIVLENANSSLEQNIPNPFTETTTIGYTIAGSFSKAVIVFNNANGQALKTVQLNSAGKGQIKIAASLVARGIYTYSLIVDGKLIETKKMIKE